MFLDQFNKGPVFIETRETQIWAKMDLFNDGTI